MPRRRTSRVKRKSPERRLHLKVSSPRIVCFEFLRYFKKSSKILVVLGLLGLAVWGVRAGVREFFIENEEFRLSAIDLETNGHMTAEHFAELTGIDPESSIFALNLRDLREQLLERPGIVKAELSRRLPGTLRVEVEEREPIAWLECRPLGIVARNPAAGILLDSSGVCFPCDVWWEEKAAPLPILLVSQVEDGDVTIGKELRHHEARRGLELLLTSQEMLKGVDWTLPVVAVRNDFSLEAATSTGVLATFGMYEHKRQLENLATLMQTTESGEPMGSVNLIPERNIPVVLAKMGSRHENRLQRDIKALLQQ